MSCFGCNEINVKVPLRFDYPITKTIHTPSSFINRMHVYQGDDVEHYYETMGRCHLSEASGFRWNKDLDSRSVLSEDFLHYDRYLGRVYFKRFYFKDVCKLSFEVNAFKVYNFQTFYRLFCLTTYNNTCCTYIHSQHMLLVISYRKKSRKKYKEK